MVGIGSNHPIVFEQFFVVKWPHYYYSPNTTIPRKEERKKKIMVLQITKDTEHGKYSTYCNYGCRCEPCKSAGSYYRRQYSKRRSTTRDGKLYKRRKSLKQKYGISVLQYIKLFKKQEGKCAICKDPEISIHHKSNKTRKLSVDHDHKTGKVRGLLCLRCNIGIGYLRDDYQLLQNATEYLRSYS